MVAMIRKLWLLLFLLTIQTVQASFDFKAFYKKHHQAHDMQPMVTEIMEQLQVKRRGVIYRTACTNFSLPGADLVTPGCLDDCQLNKLLNFLLSRVDQFGDTTVIANNIKLSFYEFLALFNGYVQQVFTAYYARDLVEKYDPSNISFMDFAYDHDWFYDYGLQETFVKRNFIDDLLNEHEVNSGRVMGMLTTLRYQLEAVRSNIEELTQRLLRLGGAQNITKDLVQEDTLDRLSQSSRSSFESLSDCAEQSTMTSDEVDQQLAEFELQYRAKKITLGQYRRKKHSLTRIKAALDRIKIAAVMGDLMAIAADDATEQKDVGLLQTLGGVGSSLSQYVGDDLQQVEQVLSDTRSEEGILQQRQIEREQQQELQEEKPQMVDTTSVSHEARRFILAALHQNADYEAVCEQIDEEGYAKVAAKIAAQGVTSMVKGVAVASVIGIAGVYAAPVAMGANMFFMLQTLVDVYQDPGKYKAMLDDIRQLKNKTAFGKGLAIARGIATLGTWYLKSYATQRVVSFAQTRIDGYLETQQEMQRRREAFHQQQAEQREVERISRAHAEADQARLAAHKEQRRLDAKAAQQQQAKALTEDAYAAKDALAKHKADKALLKQATLEEQARAEALRAAQQSKDAQAQRQHQTQAQQEQPPQQTTKEEPEVKRNIDFEFNTYAATIAGTAISGMKLAGVISLGAVSTPVVAGGAGLIAAAAFGRWILNVNEQAVASATVPQVVAAGFSLAGALK